MQPVMQQLIAVLQQPIAVLQLLFGFVINR
jgi:hypothetical protein